jgi:hypothetical protein
MGGNRYKRKNYSDDKLKELSLKIEGYRSLFDNTVIYNTEKQWRANISRHLDADSCNRFYYHLERDHYCTNCNSKLNIDSYSYTGWNKGFSKFCKNCTVQEVWKTNLTTEKLKERGKKISKSKKSFYASKKGIKTAKENGKKISKSLKKFHETEEGQLARKKSSEINSKIMRQRIISGTFTPNSNNRNTHWDAYYNGKRYRSSWEALYQYFDPDAEYETLRIPYFFENKEYIYIIDFVNHKIKIVVEVKPKELLNDKKIQAKVDAAKKWCFEHDYQFILVDKEYLTLRPIPNVFNNFDKKTEDKIKKLYEQTKN